MSDGSAPAFPWGDTIAGICGGLSKRELIAAMAMQGLLADPAMNAPPNLVAASARTYADALLLELAK